MTGALIGGMLCGPVCVLLANRHTHRIPAAHRLEWPIVMVVLGVALGLADHLHGLSSAVALVPLAVLGGAAVLVDAREGRLPDPLVAALGITTILVVAGIALVAWSEATSWLAGALVGMVLSGLGRLLAPGAWGWGDAKVLPLLGAWVGGSGVSAAITAALVITSLICATAAVLALSGSRDVLVPYGPSLLLGTLTGIITAPVS